MKIWNWIKIAIGIVFTVGVYVFLTKGSNTELKKKIDEVKTKAKEQEKIVEKIEKRVEDRKKKAKELSDKLKKHFNILIILFIVFSLSVGVVATDTIENLKIPDTYEELVEAYKEMAEIAIGYQKLYNEAEADNQALIEVTKNLQELIKVQQDMIDELLRKNRFAIFAGVDYVPLHPDYSGIMLGLNFTF